MKYAICLLALTTLLSAQAVVVPLSPSDATQIAFVHAQLVEAQKNWDTLQKAIGKKYLVVGKDDPNAGDRRWYDEVITSGTITTDALFISGDYTCKTPEETAADKAKYKVWAEAERLREAEREARSKRIRKGFDNERDFIFSDDWRYLLQKPLEPPHTPYFGIQANPVFTPTTTN
jgi:hypothetical protein